MDGINYYRYLYMPVAFTKHLSINWTNGLPSIFSVVSSSSSVRDDIENLRQLRGCPDVDLEARSANSGPRGPPGFPQCQRDSGDFSTSF